MKKLIMIILLLLSIQVAIADEIRTFNYKDVNIRLHDDTYQWAELRKALDLFPSETYTGMVQIDFKQSGDVLYLIGETHDELGASEYALMYGAKGGNVPAKSVKQRRMMAIAALIFLVILLSC